MRIKFTADHGPYKKGNTLKPCDASALDYLRQNVAIQIDMNGKKVNTDIERLAKNLRTTQPAKTVAKSK